MQHTAESVREARPVSGNNPAREHVCSTLGGVLLHQAEGGPDQEGKDSAAEVSGPGRHRQTQQIPPQQQKGLRLWGVGSSAGLASVRSWVQAPAAKETY